MTLERTVLASADVLEHQSIVSGIIREGVKNRFKEDGASAELGELWQYFGDFCEAPRVESDSQFCTCRRFSTGVKLLRGNRWVLQCIITAATFDGRTFADYRDSGEVDFLREMIEAKRAGRVTRQNRPVDVRVLHHPGQGALPKVYELAEPGLLNNHIRATGKPQESWDSPTVRCLAFDRRVWDLPAEEVRLVLDTQITREEHSDTILEPGERARLVRQMRDFIDGADIHGKPLLLSKDPVDAAELGGTVILPPKIRVRGPGERETIVKVPDASLAGLKERARQRSEHIRKYGFLQQRAINPLLAWPARLSRQGGDRLRDHLNDIWAQQGIDYRFDLVTYGNVEDIRRTVEEGGYDALLAVLPEGSAAPRRESDTHEAIKQRIPVPSQCIQRDNTLPTRWLSSSPTDLQRADPILARRIRQRYEMCLGNLLVKCHWFPFAPAEPFHYNVQVGLDVGGVHNTDAMACLGYGFRDPLRLLAFRPEEIPIDVQKAEPIPTQCLYRGLLKLFDIVHAELRAAHIQPEFDRTIFYRDGPLLGSGDLWNERDALEMLHAQLLHRGWLTSHSEWTAVEILKQAEGWRIFGEDGTLTNPVVGFCLFPYDDNRALLTTTGAPYLGQGTASPIVANVVAICGTPSQENAIRDLVWQADMSFTKPDMGMKLPWVLNVANKGALQLSRSYRISGITAWCTSGAQTEWRSPTLHRVPPYAAHVPTMRPRSTPFRNPACLLDRAAHGAEPSPAARTAAAPAPCKGRTRHAHIRLRALGRPGPRTYCASAPSISA